MPIHSFFIPSPSEPVGNLFTIHERDDPAPFRTGGYPVESRESVDRVDAKVIEVRPGAVLGLKYARGETLCFHGPARFRIQAPTSDDAPAIVDLAHGKVVCSQGLISIRTGLGAASVPRGAIGSFDYTPEMALKVHAVDGDITVGGEKANAVVPAGKMGLFSPGVAHVTTAVAPATAGQIRNQAVGKFNDITPFPVRYYANTSAGA